MARRNFVSRRGKQFQGVNSNFRNRNIRKGNGRFRGRRRNRGNRGRRFNNRRRFNRNDRKG